MIIINVVMDYLIGGAFVGTKRITDKLKHYVWNFSTEVRTKSDIVLYMNNHRHYEAAKLLRIKYIIQRKTGERSLKVPNPEDLSAIICASKKSFEQTNHSKKVLIYNGIDFDLIKSIMPKPNIDLLVAESRIGTGQRVDLACDYAIGQKRHLTILGSKANLIEDTYFKLKSAYPQFDWIGTVSEKEALSYIKGCNAIIVSNQSHGVANQIIESLSMDKQIIRFAEIEIPSKQDIDINITARKYDELIKSIIK